MPNVLHCNTLPELITEACFSGTSVVKKIIALGFSISAALSLQAQTLYQVEVIVFASNDPAAVNEETWPQPSSLTYPDNVIALLAETPLGNSTTNNTANSIASTTDTAAISTETAISSTPTNPLSTPAIYSELPLQKKTLGDWRDRLRGSSNYRVLSHSSWIQPANGPDAGKAVVISGGNQYGDHFELEGSIYIKGTTAPFKLFTNLWLSSFIPSGGIDTETTQLQLPPLPKPLAAPMTTDIITAAESGQINESAENVENSAATENGNTSITTTPLYTIQRIISHRSEDNLMTDKALYLDHPLLGVLIKLTEYKPEVDPAAAINITTSNATTP